MKATVKLRMKDFKGFVLNANSHVICNKWGICFNEIFASAKDAEEYYDKKGLKLPEYYICRVDWYN